MPTYESTGTIHLRIASLHGVYFVPDRDHSIRHREKTYCIFLNTNHIENNTNHIENQDESEATVFFDTNQTYRESFAVETSNNGAVVLDYGQQTDGQQTGVMLSATEAVLLSAAANTGKSVSVQVQRIEGNNPRLVDVIFPPPLPGNTR